MRTFLINLAVALSLISIGVGFLVYAKNANAAGVKFYIQLEKRFNEEEAKKIEYENGDALFDSPHECQTLIQSNKYLLALKIKYQGQNIDLVLPRCRPILPTETKVET